MTRSARRAWRALREFLAVQEELYERLLARPRAER
jgi:hypothetical protein